MKSYRAFMFSPEMLQPLKEKAMEDNIINRCSTFDVLVAHLWQAKTKAVFQDPTQTSIVSFAVDIRSKVNPPLPIGFVGNGVVAAFASASVHDLKENPLSYCVAEIQNAIASITDDYVRSRIDMLGVHSGMPVGINGNFLLSDWSKLSYYELDFGWGNPVYAGPIVNNISAHFVFMLSNSSQEGISVWITLGPSQMEKFEQLVSKL